MTARLAERTKRLRGEMDRARERMDELAESLFFESGSWRELLEEDQKLRKTAAVRQGGDGGAGGADFPAYKGGAGGRGGREGPGKRE